MAQWDKILSRGNVQDRRGGGPLLYGGGGLGVVGILLALAMNYFGGGDLGSVINELPNIQVAQQNLTQSDFEGADNYEVFASTVLGSANETWEQVFAQNSLQYREPTLVLFRNATQSSCGVATSSVGPHYCPADETIYLDETFFDELQKRFQAQGGDVAEAYVIAHEVGHHVQKQLGALQPSQNNAASVKTELRADCYAGMWAHSIKDLGVFGPGEITEAIDAAAAVGDDRIQKTTQGSIHPESWTHGSSEQRVSAFTVGYETGSLEACNRI